MIFAIVGEICFFVWGGRGGSRSLQTQSGRNGKTGAATIDLPKTARNVDFKVGESNSEWRKDSSG